MKNLKTLVIVAAWVVLAICVYVFLMGNEVFSGQLKNDGLSWSFLAKGIFCSLPLYLSVRLLEVLSEKSGK